MAKTVQVILAPATIFALSVTRVVALPAPPAGFINHILGVSNDMDYGTAPYIGATNLIYESEEGTDIFTDATTLPATADKQVPALKAQATQGLFSTTKALYIKANAVGSVGDSTVNSYITYEQVQIGA